MICVRHKLCYLPFENGIYQEALVLLPINMVRQRARCLSTAIEACKRLFVTWQIALLREGELSLEGPKKWVNSLFGSLFRKRISAIHHVSDLGEI